MAACYVGKCISVFIVSFLLYIPTIKIYSRKIDDGGWHTNEDDIIATVGPCNVEIRDSSLSYDEFIKKYAYSYPVVLKDVSDNSLFRELCTKENLLQTFGNKEVKLSTANTYSYEKVIVPFSKYVNEILKPQKLDALGNETQYMFGDNNYTEWDSLFRVYKQPPYILPDTEGILSFGLAGPGTGVPFHWHGPGFAEVIYGRKRWFLYPPEKTPSFHPNKTTLQWLMEDYPNLHEQDRPLECTINQGEAIYFPDRWWHGTLNIDTSVFVSTFLGPEIF
ncbi:jmjC domain-containing protein 8-like [Saccoglossus kowalevskii]|uniref:JmjC domain-containing protein 8-like n=1 Tax=Saccoglossus kowalevskii TaxID=10224 RepID=A0ABM0H144_SACKO|nr:PREDICTED: jmjC domain-containing protein 8-like [Saccoglossus kowalevskii]